MPVSCGARESLKGEGHALQRAVDIATFAVSEEELVGCAWLKGATCTYETYSVS